MKPFAVAILLATSVSPSFADLFTDDFSKPPTSTYWSFEINNTTRYTLDALHGDIRFSGPAGGLMDYAQNIRAVSALKAIGNFDVRVDFKDASIKRINGSPGNQVELLASFGGIDFYLSRSDELGNGNTIHVWQNAFLGAQTNTSTAGTLRITRVGRRVSGYLNSTLIYQRNYNTNDAEFRFLLQNNGTSDAISVTFDNFYLGADRITPSPRPQTKITRIPPSNVAISWPSWATNFSLESADSFAGIWQRVTNPPTTSGNFFVVTNSISPGMGYFRLRSP